MKKLPPACEFPPTASEPGEDAAAFSPTAIVRSPIATLKGPSAVAPLPLEPAPCPIATDAELPLSPAKELNPIATEPRANACEASPRATDELPIAWLLRPNALD
jgi:hypothetical protein